VTRVVDFQPNAASVAEARRFVKAQLAAYSTDVQETAELCVSELATNCVLHAGTAFRLRVVLGNDSVRVEVTDHSGDNPELQYAHPTDEHGRGLQIVSQLSDRWGVEQTSPGAGKTVWFMLRTA